MSEHKDSFQQISSNFAVNLYSKILEDNTNENFIFSPFSIQVLLAMIHSGTDGETAEEISKALQLPNGQVPDLIHFKEILDTNVMNGQIFMANKLYTQNGIKIIDEFKNIVKDYLHSETANVDFKKTEQTTSEINNWIKTKTIGHIQNTVKPEKLPIETNLALVNSLYLKANWYSKFHKKITYKGDFLNNDSQKIKVKMMNVYSGMYDYCELEELNAKALIRPYEYQHLSILFIVPNQNSNLNELEKNIKKINFFDICDKMKSTQVKLHVPKFTIESENDIEILLNKMGVKKLFGDEANFTKSLVPKDPIKITKIIHKVCFDCNEEGTVAVPAIHADFNLCICPPFTAVVSKNFFLDKPFLYAVKDDKTIYYFGRVKTLSPISMDENLKYIPISVTHIEDYLN